MSAQRIYCLVLLVLLSPVVALSFGINDIKREGGKAWNDTKREGGKAWNDTKREGKKAWDDTRREAGKAWKDTTTGAASSAEVVKEQSRRIGISQQNINSYLNQARQRLKNTPFDARTWAATERYIWQRMQNTPFDPASWAETERLVRNEIQRGLEAAREKARVDAVHRELKRIDDNYAAAVNRLDHDLSAAQEDLLQSREAAVARVEKQARQMQETFSRTSRQAQQQLAHLQKDYTRMQEQMFSALETADEALEVDPAEALRQKAKLLKAQGRKFDQQVFQPTLDDTKALGRQFDEQVTRPLIADPLTGLLNTDLVVYDFVTNGSFTVNLSSGTYWMRMDLPMGMAVDSTDFKNWLQGNLALPDLDPIEIATQGAITNTNNYASFHSRTRGEYTYVASKRFVDWFSLETAANEILQAYLTAGSSTRSSLEAIKEYFLLEWNDLYSWLENQGIEQVSEVSMDLFQAIISQQPLHLDNLGISASLEWVPYTYKLDVNIDPRLGGALETIGIMPFDKEKVLASSPHLAFVVRLNGMQRNRERSNQINHLESILQQEPRSLVRILQQSLTTQSYPAINALVADGIPSQDPLDGVLRSFFSGSVDLRTAGNQAGISLPSVVDLRDSQAGAKIQDLLGRLAFGNQGKARLEKLELNLSNYRVVCEIRLNHKHSWGSIQEIKAGINEFARKTGRQLNPNDIASMLVQR